MCPKLLPFGLMFHFASKVVTFRVNVTFCSSCYILRRNKLYSSNTWSIVHTTRQTLYHQCFHPARQNNKASLASLNVAILWSIIDTNTIPTRKCGFAPLSLWAVVEFPSVTLFLPRSRRRRRPRPFSVSVFQNCVAFWFVKFRTTGFEPVTSRYRCDALTNWAMKPLTLGAGHSCQAYLRGS